MRASNRRSFGPGCKASCALFVNTEQTIAERVKKGGQVAELCMIIGVRINGALDANDTDGAAAPASPARRRAPASRVRLDIDFHDIDDFDSVNIAESIDCLERITSRSPSPLPPSLDIDEPRRTATRSRPEHRSFRGKRARFRACPSGCETCDRGSGRSARRRIPLLLATHRRIRASVIPMWAPMS